MAEIHPHPDLEGVVLPFDVLSNLTLFAKNKNKNLLKKYPTYVVVKRFAKGEIICRQGEPGWSAYYILTPEDTIAVLEHQRQHVKAAGERVKIDADLAVFRQRSEKRRTNPDDVEGRQMATVFVAIPRSGRVDKTTTTRLGNAMGHSIIGPMKNYLGQTIFTPVGHDPTVNVDSLRAPLSEGELFGEYSCLYRTPRTATILARRDCYMIEVLRNIFDNVIKRDPAYAGPAAEIERKRFLETGMSRLSLFADFTKEEYEQVKNIVELVGFEPGQLIFDEFDRADGIYIIRSGMIKELKNVSALLAKDDVLDWTKLIAALREGETTPTDYRGRLWASLPEPARDAVRRTPADQPVPRREQIDVTFGLNEVLKMPRLADAAEFATQYTAMADSPRGLELAAERAKLRDDPKAKKEKEKPELVGAKLRRLNRLLLETLLPKVFRPSRPGPECILNYYSPGDYVCGYGVLDNQPSNITCIAFDHPDNQGQVQLVRLPAEALRNVCERNPKLKEKLVRELARRRKHSMERLLTPVWDDSNQVQLSDKFEELGLIQGQRLMLIDLDRCTRCDECVKACVNTHADGRSRLFLDGPRFGKYLVPISCRSCLDPVCMIPCPVSSIHRGDYREMVIEDWCIGCGLCADSCPYGSIQMHDLGLIPERARGWRFAPAGLTTGEKWIQPGFGDGKWLSGSAPFQHDRTFRELLEAVQGEKVAKDDPILFRYPFTIAADDLFTPGLKKAAAKPVQHNLLIVTSHAEKVEVWLDGNVLPVRKPRQGQYKYLFPVKYVATVPIPGEKVDEELVPMALAAGRHLLAVRVKPPVKEGAKTFLLKMGLFPERRPDLPAGAADDNVAEELTEKLVTQRAVVCDLCATLPGHSPACVRACPHDAAMRVNARRDFPQQ